VAADGNTSETMYPDQSLYAYDSVPTMVRRINNAFKRADEIQWSRGIEPGTADFVDYFLPIVADAEAGFGGVLNAFELMKNMIVNGAAGVHFEDQLAAVKKCGHMGGKVLVPTQEAVQKLIAARLAADVMGVPSFHAMSSRRLIVKTVPVSSYDQLSAIAPGRLGSSRPVSGLTPIIAGYNQPDTVDDEVSPLISGLNVAGSPPVLSQRITPPNPGPGASPSCAKIGIAINNIQINKKLLNFLI